MKLPLDKVYRVTLEETYKDNSITIVQAILDIRAPDMETACTKARDYWGMGMTITITKCELLCG